MVKEKYKYKISVVIPVYNAEEYLEETINSVLKQDIGFVDNVQMILVNDGSVDGSEKLCQQYEKKYPKNITYVYQENAGVSAARNHGMEYVEGKYVNFLDSDDMWSSDAFSRVYSFFEEHYDEVELVSCKQQYFEGATHVHVLSEKKYDCTRVTDIHHNYEDIQMHITASFIRSDIMECTHFDENMRFGEDAVYVNEIILRKGKYGLVAEPTHYYRRRINATSAVQNKQKSLEWYFQTPIDFYQRLANLSRKEYGEVIPYIQSLIMYEIQWRIREKVELFLDKHQQKDYLKIIRNLLLDCDDDIIVAPKTIGINQKIFLLSLKYKRDIREEFVYMNKKIYFHNIPILNLENNHMFLVEVIQLSKSEFICTGLIMCPFLDKMQYWIQNEEGERFEIRKDPTLFKERRLFGIKIMQNYMYEVKLPAYVGAKYQIFLCYDKKNIINISVPLGKFSKLTSQIPHCYYANEDYILEFRNKCFSIEKFTEKECRNREKIVLEELEGLLHDEKSKEKVLEGRRNAIELRKDFWRAKKKKKKQVWLISDRIHVAGDNGEAFFEFMQNHPQKDIDTYFVISNESKDYQRLKKIGNVVGYKTRKHLILTMIADLIVSSQGEDNIFNPFEEAYPYVRSLLNYEFVFLQHGITKDDLSLWLNKCNKNIGMFITAAKPEYQAVLKDPYFYDESVIKLTGLSRYDKLVQTKPSKKQIIFLPTWRVDLALEMDQETGVRPYNPQFKKSRFFEFYNQLINDERILNVLRLKGYTGKFCLHPNNMPNVDDFQENDVIHIERKGINYRDEFVENAMLITDYSSVAFDFGYLKKPIIYAQFDEEEFFGNAVYDKGYWDYSRDGFGPVCHTYEETVKIILEYLKNDCVVAEEFEMRMKNFYYKMDQENSKRIYEAIRQMGN